MQEHRGKSLALVKWNVSLRTVPLEGGEKREKSKAREEKLNFTRIQAGRQRGAYTTVLHQSLCHGVLWPATPKGFKPCLPLGAQAPTVPHATCSRTHGRRRCLPQNRRGWPLTGFCQRCCLCLLPPTRLLQAGCPVSLSWKAETVPSGKFHTCIWV